MPHLIIEHSPGLPRTLIERLCEIAVGGLASLRREDGSHEFPPDGTFARAHEADVVRSGLPDGEFFHCLLKIGPGRPASVKRETGELLMHLLCTCLEGEAAGPPLQLSLELCELPVDLAWKQWAHA